MTKQKNKEQRLKKKIIKHQLGATRRKGFGFNYFKKEKQ